MPIASPAASLLDVAVSESPAPDTSAGGYVSPDQLPEQAGRLQLFAAGALVFLPLAAIVLAGVAFWDHGITWLDLGLAVGMYIFTGIGLSVGFHRHFTHHSFECSRWLKVTLAIAGTMALEGSVITWVSQHRRHHVFADRVGDPHSPVPDGPGASAKLRGLWHAHAGWLFVPNEVNSERWSPDLRADPDLVRITSMAPLLSVLSFALPALVGWLVTGTLWGLLMAGLWGGVIRVAMLHHVTWGTNSLCHTFGSRPFRSNDQSTNLGSMAFLSFGDSWHNAHHAFPGLARHGVDRGQIDIAAGTIGLFERFGWATKVRWPRPTVLARRRITAGRNTLR